MATIDHEKSVRSMTAVDVARILRERILAGHYPADRFIRQELIAQELGVSRIPVREALAQLETEGLLVRQKYRGAAVPRLSETEIEEICALREMIEPYLLRAAIARITADEITALRDLLARSEHARDRAEWEGFNREFHRALYAPAQKPLSMQLLDNLMMRTDRYLKLQQQRPRKSLEDWNGEHRRILDCVACGDTDGAVAILSAHIRWNAGADGEPPKPDRAAN